MSRQPPTKDRELDGWHWQQRREGGWLPTLGRAAWIWERLPPADLVEKLKNPYDVE